MIRLEVATPQTVIAYAQYMEEQKYFEDSFRVYEKGIQLFNYPHVYPIWLCYLRKFISRYEGSKIERTRDLFEQAVQGVPAQHAHVLYLLYAKFEEDHGLARRAMLVYDRCCNVLEPKDKAKMYYVYINRCAEFFGITKTREIYERAIKSLPDDHLLAMCKRYADLERKLGEIDRARLIYTFASQYADTHADADFWKLWQEFEVHFGNKQTFLEMMRISRSVEEHRSSLNLTSIRRREAEEQKVADSSAKRVRPPSDAMADKEVAAAEAEAALPPAKRRAAIEEREQAARAAQETAEERNREEMNIDLNEDEEGVGAANLEQIQVPDAVFGTADAAQSSLGALERMRRAAQGNSQA
jgi:pre-mRNA-splicing factor SYF1